MMHTPAHKAPGGDCWKPRYDPSQIVGNNPRRVRICGCAEGGLLPAHYCPQHNEVRDPVQLELFEKPLGHVLTPREHPLLKELIDALPNERPPTDGDPMRGFDSGATRTNDAGRIDPEGFISPTVLLRFCEYMNRNRVQADGNIRASDNWQKGIPIEAYRKSIQRHDLELWAMTRDANYKHPENKSIEDVLCALMFNVMGMLHETLKVR